MHAKIVLLISNAILQLKRKKNVIVLLQVQLKWVLTDPPLCV